MNDKYLYELLKALDNSSFYEQLLIRHLDRILEEEKCPHCGEVSDV